MGKRKDFPFVDDVNDEYIYGELSKISNEASSKNSYDSKLETNKFMKHMFISLYPPSIIFPHYPCVLHCVLLATNATVSQ
jgi:hypothetical protein